MTFPTTLTKRQRRPGLALIVFGCIAVAGRVKASDVRPLSIEEAVRVPAFGAYSPVVFSSDGKYLACVVADRKLTKSSDDTTWSMTGVPWYAAGTSIVVADFATGATVRVTEDDSNNWLPAWSPDGRSLAFLSDRGGYAKLWIWDRLSHEVRKVSDTVVNTTKVEWTLDGQRVLLTARPSQKIAAVLPSVSTSPGNAGAVVSESPHASVLFYTSSTNSSGHREIASSDPWNLDEELRDLQFIEVSTGRSTTLVQGQRITSFSLSPDSSTVAYTIPKRFEKAGSQQILYDLSIDDLRTAKKQIVASNIRLDFDASSFSWSPDSRHLSFRTGGMEEKVNDCSVADLNGATPMNISGFSASSTGVPHRTLRPLWGADGKHVYFVRDGVLWFGSVDGGTATQVAQVPQHQITQLISVLGNLLWEPAGKGSTIVLAHDPVGLQDSFYSIDLSNGQTARLLERGQCYSCVAQNEYVSVSGDGARVAFFSEDARSYPQLWTSIPDFAKLRRLTHLAPEFERYELGHVQLLDWLSDDGGRLRGALLLPSSYQKGARYPLITYVYGGIPLSAYADRFGLGYGGPFNMQLLATRGYAVLLPDSPQGLGSPVLDLIKTVLPGINKVIEMGIADPDHLGLIGHSNGGYDTLALITHTKRFKAAVEMDGMGDLLSLYGAMDKAGSAYGTSNVEHGQNALGGTPWEVRDAYIENSPFFYLDRVETPLLMIQGGEDETVPPFLADQVFVGLRRLGKQVEYAKYPNEGHFPAAWSAADQLDVSVRMIDWLDQHLKQ